ncbi:MAG TPA: hypothetical protein VM925_18010 [Labilithrix sp.]|nr:hypothetical protein [Labilithrix sp.]
MRALPIGAIGSAALVVLLSASSATAQSAPPASNGAAPRKDDPEPDEAAANLVLQKMGLAQKKAWLIGSVFETHRLLRQDDLGGAARNKALNYLSLYAGWSPTPKDQIQLRGGFYQRFLADSSETGVRPDDLVLSYTRTIPLPWELMLRPSISNLFPISFDSRLMGLYAVPRAGVSLMRNFLDGDLNVNLRAGGAAYIGEYKSALGGSANPVASTTVGIGVNYSMPFHRNLQIGANVQTTFYWNHEVEHGNNAVLNSQFASAPVQPTKDPQFESQPTQQTYGGEIYVAYQLPTLFDMQSNIQLALAQGEPNVIHDGRTHVYWMFRRSAQAYLALQVQY